MSRYYYLGPWRSVFDESMGEYLWMPPEGTVGLVDLRPSVPTSTFGFFATDQPVNDSNYEPFGDGVNRLEDIRLTLEQRNRWASMLGLDPLSATTLLDALWETLTVQADPTGLERCKPLMPNHLGVIELHLGDHSLLKSEKFSLDLPYWPKIQGVLQADYRRIEAGYTAAVEDAVAKLGGGKIDIGGKVEPVEVAVNPFHQKWLGSLCRDLGITAEQATTLIVPSDMDPVEPITPTTKITDNFNRADYSSLSGPGSPQTWTWVEITGSQDVVPFIIVNGMADGSEYGVTGPRVCVADYSFSSGNHRARATFVTLPNTKYASLEVRVSGYNEWTTLDRYSVYLSPGVQFKVYRRTGALGATLLTPYSDAGDVMRSGAIAELRVTGSTLSVWSDADGTPGTLTQRGETINDVVLTGNVRTGWTGVSTYSPIKVDDFEAEDLAAPAAIVNKNSSYGYSYSAIPKGL